MAPPTAVDIVSVDDTTSITLPDPLTVNGVSARRAKAGPAKYGIAASASSDLFKSPHNFLKPKAKRWDHKFNEESKARKQPSIKSNAKYLKQPGLISLGGGLPSSEYFPFQEISFKAPSVPHFSEQETKESGVVLTTGKYDVSEGHGAYDLSIGLNYGQGHGSAQMLRFVTEHTEIVHNPPYADWACNMTVGSTSGLEVAYRIFTEPGDYILTEEYTFATAMETALPLGLHPVGIAMDEQGLLPSSMDSILSNWDPSARNGAKKPCFLYTVPSGQNPTGATQSLERRREVYKIAQKHDVYIVEDEPYYFLQMQPYTPDSAPIPPPSTHKEFIAALVPSLLSLDTDGRVMRLDSFSKVIAPGTRTGWITASAQVCERFIYHYETSVQNPSGFSQLVLHKLLDEHWGHGGYLDWLLFIRLEYTWRRDAILRACEKHLPRAVASWNPPAAGMFLWIKLDWRKHPAAVADGLGVLALEKRIFDASTERGVLLTVGSWFRAEQGAEPAEMFFRATFATASAEGVELAIGRFGEALREEFKL